MEGAVGAGYCADARVFRQLDRSACNRLAARLIDDDTDHITGLKTSPVGWPRTIWREALPQ